MSSTILLTNNNQEINLIDTFIESLTPLQSLTNSFNILRTLELSTINDIQTCKSSVLLSNKYYEYNPQFEKNDNIDYSSAIVKDQTFVNNLLYFQNDYSIPLLEIKIKIDNTFFICNKYIEISDKNYYILSQM